MPVTKTAKRALRGSKRKAGVNKLITTKLKAAIRMAKKSKTASSVVMATKLADRAAKKNVINKNKAARIKSSLSRLVPVAKAKPAKKVTSK